MKGNVIIATVLATVIQVGDVSAASRSNESQGKVVVSGDEAIRIAEVTAKQRERLDFLAAPIKNRSDLSDYMARTPKSMSPFRFLSDGARNRFVESLVFNENGLVGFDYSELASELNARQALQILALFGAQRIAGIIPYRRVESDIDREIMAPTMRMIDDHKDYRCESHATCTAWNSKICMSGC